MTNSGGGGVAASSFVSSTFRRLYAGEVILAAALVAWRIGDRSFWLDEAYTWSTVDRSAPSLISLTAREEAYQILHQLLLWPWARISTDEWWLRLPSAVAFVACVALVVAIGRRWFDPAVGLVAGALLALSGFAISLGQEARSYPFAMLFATAAVGAFVDANRNPSPRAQNRWIVLAALAVWMHGFAVFAIVAPVAVLGCFAPWSEQLPRWRRSLVRVACAVAVPLLLPLVQTDSGQVYSFVEDLSLRSVADVVFSVLGRSGAPAVVLGFASLLALGRLRAADGARAERAALWAVVAGPPVALGVASVVQPVLLDRYLVTVLPSLCLLIADLVVAFRVEQVRRAAIAVVVVAAAVGAVRWERGGPLEDWRGATRLLAERAAADDALVFSTDEGRIGVEYYVRPGSATARLATDGPEPAWPEGPWGGFRTGDQVPESLPDAVVRGLAAAGPARLWLVVAKSPRGTESRLVASFDGYAIASRHEFEGITVVLLHRGDTPQQ